LPLRNRDHALSGEWSDCERFHGIAVLDSDSHPGMFLSFTAPRNRSAGADRANARPAGADI
jgi:hypothetical protein